MVENLITSEEFDSSVKTNKDLNSKTVIKKKTNPNQKNKQNKQIKQQTQLNNSQPIEVVEIPNQNKTKSKTNLKISFLGGIGEIGKNMTVIEYGKDIVVIDCGVMFPSIDMLGIDLVVPDITYLLENQDKIKGFIITHGHEDHIGSVPYVVNEIKAPIYASKMTCGLIKKKMEEHKKVEYKVNAVKPKQKITLGCFEIEFIHVNHAIPGAFALAIKTPVGMLD